MADEEQQDEKQQERQDETQQAENQQDEQVPRQAPRPAQRLPLADSATRAMKTKSRRRKKKPTTSREELTRSPRLVDNPAMTKASGHVRGGGAGFSQALRRMCWRRGTF